MPSEMEALTKEDKDVLKFYRRLDSSGGENVTLACLEDNYSVLPNPEYVSGQKSEA